MDSRGERPACKVLTADGTTRCPRSRLYLKLLIVVGGLVVLAGLIATFSCSEETPVAQTSPPVVPHGAPNESPLAEETCVACHACGVETAPVIDRSHRICTECHGPPPDYVTRPKGEGSCGFEMDCTKDPPEVNCFTACHEHTIREVNAMCERCHIYR